MFTGRQRGASLWSLLASFFSSPHFCFPFLSSSMPAGRTICKLHLAPGELHADINGDGVVDHVQVRRRGEMV
jgi:hypothetical protein